MARFPTIRLVVVLLLFATALLSCCNIEQVTNSNASDGLRTNGDALTGKRNKPDPRPWWGRDSMLTAKRWGPYQFWDTTAQLYPVMPLEDSATGFVGIGHNQFHGKWSVYFFSAELDTNNRPTALEAYFWLYAAPMSTEPRLEGTYSTAVYTGYDIRIPNDRYACLRDTIRITDRTTGHSDSVIGGVSGRYPLPDTLQATLRPIGNSQGSSKFDYTLYNIPTITAAHGNNSAQRGRVMLRWLIERYNEGNPCKGVPNPFPVVVRLYGVRTYIATRQTFGFVEDVPIDLGLQTWKPVTRQTNDGDPSDTSVR